MNTWNSVAQKFQELLNAFKIASVNQAFLKDEAIQLIAENLMLFIVENGDIIEKSLFIGQSLENPSDEFLDKVCIAQGIDKRSLLAVISAIRKAAK